jgi:hypothetical protein
MKNAHFVILFVLLFMFNFSQKEGNIMARENVSSDDPIKKEITEMAIFELNKNSYFGYDFLSLWDENIDEKIKKECNGKKIQNYMSYDYYGDDIIWIFSGYPNDECSYFLTNISFSSNKYNVFGIKPGDDISISLDKIKELGFEPNKGDLYISFKPQIIDNKIYSTIGTIIIEVKTYYLGNRIY